MGAAAKLHGRRHSSATSFLILSRAEHHLHRHPLPRRAILLAPFAADERRRRSHREQRRRSSWTGHPAPSWAELRLLGGAPRPGHRHGPLLAAGAALLPDGRATPSTPLLCDRRKKKTSALLCLKKTMVVPMMNGPHLKEQCHLKITDFLLSCKIYISYLVAPKIV
jgi:hypothetical protein